MNTTFQYPKYTYNDYKNWKDDWQLIHGFPLQLLPSATPKHSKTQGRLITQANNSLDKNPLACNCAVFNELDWKINDETIVRPDIMIICGNLSETILEFPPILIIEVLSPFNLKTDRIIKFDLYRENGVKFYLMVDCLKESVEVYELIDNYYKQVEKSKFLLERKCEIEFDFDKIWK